VPRFLCFSAHPDDAEFVCTGTLLRLLERGWQGALAVLTNGENGFKVGEATSATERAAVRRREQEAAAAQLGVPLVMLDHRDGFLAETEELRRQLVELIRAHRPDVVFSFDPANQQFDDLNLFHRDHRVAARAVFDAVFAARNRWMYPGEPHAVGELHFYGSHAPDRFVDVTAQMDRKLALLACHASQFPDPDRVARFVREDITGPHGDARHCERFRVLPVVRHT
jgi:LmbE family N-acetylglucosaminyl deacetylase